MILSLSSSLAGVRLGVLRGELDCPSKICDRPIAHALGFEDATTVEVRTSVPRIDLVAPTYRATVDVPARFRNSKAVGAVFGLTPSKYQSDRDRSERQNIGLRTEMMRMMLYEAAQVMLLRSSKWSWLKAWAMIARHRGMKKAIVALARRLAVIMHRIWVDGTEFRLTRELAVA
jgi:hypothetical protein